MQSSQSLFEWLNKSETQDKLKLSYPDLSSRVYPLNSENWEALCSDSSLLLRLNEMRGRARFSTVPLGSFVGIGQTKWVGGNGVSRLKLRSVQKNYFKKSTPATWRDLDSTLEGVTALQANPLVYLKAGELHFLGSSVNPSVAQYDWKRIPAGEMATEIVAFLQTIRSTKETIEFLGTRGIEESHARIAIAELVKQQVVLSNLLIDRFSLRQAQSAPEKDPESKTDSVAIVDCEGELSVPTTLMKDLELASRFIVSLCSTNNSFLKALEESKVRFRRAFDTRSVPLLEILDPHSGFSLPSIPEKMIPFEFPEEISAVISKAIVENKAAVFDRAQIQKYLNSVCPGSPSFSTSFFVSSKKGSVDSLWIRRVFAGMGIRPISRFLRFLPGASAEQFYPIPDENLIFAEVGGSPQITNRDLFEVACKGHYIDFYGPPRDGELRIEIKDLSVLLQDNFFVLWCRKRKKFIVPVFSNAANPAIDQHPAAQIFRFIAQQFSAGDCQFPWGAWSAFPTLPEVRMENIVLTPKKYSLDETPLDKNKVYCVYQPDRDLELFADLKIESGKESLDKIIKKIKN